jgi:molybdate transport system substrate-binding protein
MRIVLILAGLCLWMVRPVTADNHETFIVFAASSLTNVFTELADAFTDEYDRSITLQFAGSSTLAAQIDQGAPADIFASANETQIQFAVESGRVAESAAQVFATNRLVMIVPADNPAAIQHVADLARPGVLLVLAQENVPVREYTDALLQTLAEDDAYGADFPQTVYDNLVSEEANVRQVASRVALGEADAGIVYQTDITPDIIDEVQMIALPPGSSPVAHYPIAMLNDSSQPEIAAQFTDFVLSERGQTILRRWGFCPPPDTTETTTPDAESIESAESAIEATPETTPDAEATPAPLEPACN